MLTTCHCDTGFIAQHRRSQSVIETLQFLGSEPCQTKLGEAPRNATYECITWFPLSPKHVAGRLSLPVAADRNRDRNVAMALVENTGVNAVYSGTLARSWHQQPGATVSCEWNV